MGAHHDAPGREDARPAGPRRCDSRLAFARDGTTLGVALDALPPSPPAAYAYGPGDIYPRGEHEAELCATASHPDWLYLGGLVLLDVGSVAYDSVGSTRDSSSAFVRYTAPAAVGLTWGATLGGGWLAMPKCDPHWVGEPPREGEVRAAWPLALSIALVAGATAPIMNGVVVGTLPQDWSTNERAMHLVAAGVAGFAGALLPYLSSPATWSASRELEKIRVAPATGGGFTLGYAGAF